MSDYFENIKETLAKKYPDIADCFEESSNEDSPCVLCGTIDKSEHITEVTYKNIKIVKLRTGYWTASFSPYSYIHLNSVIEEIEHILENNVSDKSLLPLMQNLSKEESAVIMGMDYIDRLLPITDNDNNVRSILPYAFPIYKLKGFKILFSGTDTADNALSLISKLCYNENLKFVLHGKDVKFINMSTNKIEYHYTDIAKKYGIVEISKCFIYLCDILFDINIKKCKSFIQKCESKGFET